MFDMHDPVSSPLYGDEFLSRRLAGFYPALTACRTQAAVAGDIPVAILDRTRRTTEKPVSLGKDEDTQLGRPADQGQEFRRQPCPQVGGDNRIDLSCVGDQHPRNTIDHRSPSDNSRGDGTRSMAVRSLSGAG